MDYNPNYEKLVEGTYFTIDSISDRMISEQYSISRQNNLLFASIIGYDTLVKNALRSLNSAGTHHANAGNRYSALLIGSGFKKNYEISEKYIKELKGIHVVLKKKDLIDNASKRHQFYFYNTGSDLENADNIKKELYEKLDKHTGVPMLREWVDYVYDRLKEDFRVEEMTTYSARDSKDSVFVTHIKIDEEEISDYISQGLKNKEISINGSNEYSEALNNVVGLDSYLNTFNKQLTDKIQESFRPKFVPGVDKYDKYVDYIDDFVSKKDKVEMYEAQKITIQAAVNNMKTNKTTNIIGECGSGKTLIASSVVYAHHANKNIGFNAIVMCPPHLVTKWKREVEARIPNARAYIISNTDDLINIKDKLLDKTKSENSYVIISKESAKLSYELRPAGVWSETKKTFICPDCGEKLYIEKKIGSGRRARKEKVFFNEKSFMKKDASNSVCKNCGSKLWTCSNKNENTEWFKLGAAGWVLTRHIAKLGAQVSSAVKVSSKKDSSFNKEILKQYSLFKQGLPYESNKRSPRKVSVAYYIKKFLNGAFDYCILDEAHELKGKSEQGYASYDLIKSSKKTLLLTGTLLNGYADSLFYILYRTNSNLMKKEGFEYNDEAEFARLYGVYSNSYTTRLGVNGERRGTTNTRQKRLPGVSPLVFTKFLLNNSVFLSLSDMEDGLPPYNEYPIGIDIKDDELRAKYDEIEAKFREISRNKDKSAAASLPLIQSMTIYPDAPHCIKPIYDSKTNELILEPAMLEEKNREKDIKLLEIVKEKIAKNEKVLVYYNSVNSTNVGNHLIKMFKENNIMADELKSSEKADKREEWIDKKIKDGLNVLICNPKLVETGLDLIDFTTIVFYQVGYNLFTMRQASRRSWRLSQNRPISVYFLYYKDTIQEQALSLMATKLHASMAIEGKFSEEGLRALSNNEDILTQVAKNVTEGIKENVKIDMFTTNDIIRKKSNKKRYHKYSCNSLEYNIDDTGHRMLFGQLKSRNKNVSYVDIDSSILKSIKRPKQQYVYNY